MSRDINDLEPDFAVKCRRLIEQCFAKGVEVRPYYTRRDPFEQARLWRQSRTSLEIVRKVSYLRQTGCHFIADVIESVGPQNGKWATNAIPGESWHNHGLAMDCFVVGEHGRAIWEADHPGYAVYADTAKELGIVSRIFGDTRDIYHVQARNGSPSDVYTLKKIDDIMKTTFA